METIEEKARAYDEAIKKAKSLYKASEPMSGCSVILETLFPELAESEDEKIRKEIIDFLKLPHPQFVGKRDHEKWIDWLEKQSEQKSDKVKPKFNIGDFIANDYCFGKVIALTDDAYLLDTEQGIPFSCEHNTHLWTIQDAKDGDVLADYAGVILFRKIGNDAYADVVDYYCVVTTNGRFEIQEKFGYWGETNDAELHPATKEQRDTLMKAMTDAGYTFDFDKKELRKVEQKSVDKVEPFDKYEGLTDFERTLADICIGWIGEELGWKQYIKDNANVLLKIAIKKFNSVQDVPFEQKSAWSEEDEYMLNETIQHLEELIRIDKANHCSCDVQFYQRDIDWLNSFRPQNKWKPSELQLGCLSDAIEYYNSSGYPAPKLKELYEQLKKLKEE